MDNRIEIQTKKNVKPIDNFTKNLIERLVLKIFNLFESSATADDYKSVVWALLNDRKPIMQNPLATREDCVMRTCSGLSVFYKTQCNIMQSFWVSQKTLHPAYMLA